MLKEPAMLLQLLPYELSVCRFDPGKPVPDWAWEARFVSVTRTEEELSIFCDSAVVPEGEAAPGVWRAFRVAGQLDLELPGIISQLAVPLAARQISIFSLSTHDTDYMVVGEHQFQDACEVLRRAGHTLEEPS
jgi:hypothetical protein